MFLEDWKNGIMGLLLTFFIQYSIFPSFHFNPKSKILIIWHLNYLLRRTDVEIVKALSGFYSDRALQSIIMTTS